MFKKIKTLVAFMLAFAFAMSAPVVAQDSTPESDSNIAAAFEYGYFRMYADPAMQGQGSPEAGEVAAYMIGAMKPQEGDAAKLFEEDFRGFSDAFAGGFFENADEMPDAEEVDDIGDEAYEYMAEMDGMPVTALMVRDGDLAIVSVALGVSEAGAANAPAEFVVDADESEEPVEFDEDGASTGGVFDMLPPAGDDSVDGLEPIMDLDMVTGAGT